MVEISSLHVGDRIKIVDRWCGGCNQNHSGKMDKYLGREAIVVDIRATYAGTKYVTLDTDHGDWAWFAPAIDCIIDDSISAVDNTVTDAFLNMFGGV